MSFSIYVYITNSHYFDVFIESLSWYKKWLTLYKKVDIQLSITRKLLKISIRKSNIYGLISLRTIQKLNNIWGVLKNPCVVCHSSCTFKNIFRSCFLFEFFPIRYNSIHLPSPNYWTTLYVCMYVCM